MSKIYILLLLLDAAIVTYGLYKKRNMWLWIALYWTILTLKNLTDMMCS